MLLSQGYLAQDQQHSPNESIGVSSPLLHNLPHALHLARTFLRGKKTSAFPHFSSSSLREPFPSTGYFDSLLQELLPWRRAGREPGTAPLVYQERQLLGRDVFRDVGRFAGTWSAAPAPCESLPWEV